MRFSFQVCVFFAVVCALGDGIEQRSGTRGNIFAGRRTPAKNATRFKSLEPIATQAFKRLQRELYSLFEELIFDPEISTECSSAFQKIMTGLQNFEFWAISFARSSGGLPSMLNGDTVDLGNYDACLGAVARNSEGKTTFSGRYCTLLLTIDNPLFDKLLVNAAKSQPRLLDLFDNNLEDFVSFNKAKYLRIGICMPSTCNADSIEYSVKKLGGDYGIEPWVLGCRAKSEDPPLSRFQVLVICSIILLVALCLLGSCVDARHANQGESNEGTGSGALEIVRSFSIQRSWDSVFNFQVKKSEKYLASIHGLRALSAIYILWFHVYSVIDPLTIKNSQQIAEWVRYDISFLPIYMGVHAVETFFCISGALAFRAYYKEFQNQRKSISAMIGSDLIRRWIRMAIPSVALIAIYNMLFLMTSGPTKDYAEPYFWGKCVKNWWTIPTMLSNIKTAEDSCLLHLWYVGVDFQLRLLFLIPIIAMASGSEYGALGFSLASTMGLISVVFVSLTTFHNRILPVGMPSPRFLSSLLEIYNYVQSKPMTHFGSFAFGVCTMYIMELQRSGKMRKFPKSFIGLLWIGVFTGGLINYFVPFYWQTGGDPWNAKSAFYAGLTRLYWSGVVSWIIYVCAMGHGGPINWLLTPRGLIPISRLSFAFYLVHVFVVEYKVLHQRGYHEARHYLQTITTLGCFVVTLFCAFVFYCLVENPVNNLLSLYFGASNQPKVPDVERKKEVKLPEIKPKASEIPVEKCYL